jgi:hypothetical protein
MPAIDNHAFVFACFLMMTIPTAVLGRRHVEDPKIVIEEPGYERAEIALSDIKLPRHQFILEAGMMNPDVYKFSGSVDDLVNYYMEIACTKIAQNTRKSLLRHHKNGDTKMQWEHMMGTVIAANRLLGEDYEHSMSI